MKKGLAVAIALLAIGLAGWYFASPSMAMNSLRSAAIEGDREELKERVDFPALRESLKEQVRAHMVAEMAKEKDSNPFAALGMAMAGAIVDPMIDGIVSPAGIKAMVQQGRMVDATADKAAAPKDSKPVDWKIDRRGFTKFVATPEVQDGGRAPSLIFKRDGIGWDLVDIEIPNGGLGGPSKT